MRISDDRYTHERQRLDCALRFLRLEARTQTIRVWTGLTDDRIRNLYRSYISRGTRFVPRHEENHRNRLPSSRAHSGCSGKLHSSRAC